MKFLREFWKSFRRNKKKTVTLCGKTNVLTFAFDLWERTFYEVAKEYPDIKTDYAHVDATCMWMVKNPEWFDVIVTDNMFGDIISDIGAATVGGLGISPTSEISASRGYFQAAHGSAPDIAGKGIANPIAQILCAAMMLRYSFGANDSAQRIERAAECSGGPFVRWRTSAG